MKRPRREQEDLYEEARTAPPEEDYAGGGVYPPEDEPNDYPPGDDGDEGPVRAGCSWFVIFALAMILALIGAGVWAVNWMRTRAVAPHVKEAPSAEISLLPSTSVQPNPGEQQVQIFYLVGGQALAGEARRLPDSATGTRRLKMIAEELTRSPSSDIKQNPLPPGTIIRGTYLVDNVAVIDLSRDFLAVKDRSPMQEKLTVYALVNSFMLNDPGLQGVRILVEGKPVETAWGWLDLSSPLGPDLSLIK